MMHFLHPKLLKLVGTWALIATTNLEAPLKSELRIDYAQVEFASIQYLGFVKFQKTCYGQVMGAGSRTDVVWLKLMDLTVDTGVLPPIQIPVPPQNLYRMRITEVVEDDATATFTVAVADHKYTFRRQLERTPSRDPILKLFATQLAFDYVIHLKDHLPSS